MDCPFLGLPFQYKIISLPDFTPNLTGVPVRSTGNLSGFWSAREIANKVYGAALAKKTNAPSFTWRTTALLIGSPEPSWNCMLPVTPS